jgi:Rab GDP dissociation inhibitor
MDEEYDIIALGTGLKECMLSGLMSSVGTKNVLHMDRNHYYGGECASLNLEQLYDKFRNGDTPPASFGRSRDYCIDLCPKFIMACGNLVRILLLAKVTHYLEFQSVAGSYVTNAKGLHKLPTTAKEALASNLMGMFQKRRYKAFITWVNDYDASNPKTHSGLDLKNMTSSDVFKYWKLEEETQTFTGHALVPSFAFSLCLDLCTL